MRQDENSSNRFKTILVVAFVIGGFFYFMDTEEDTSSEAAQDTTNVEVDRRTEAATSLADSFSADASWNEHLDNFGLTILTEDLRKLLTNGNQPVFAYLELIDLERRGEQYTGQFLYRRFRYRELIQFDLALDSTVANRLLEWGERDNFYLYEFPVVAEVDSVSSRTLYTRDQGGSYEVEQLFTVHGILLGIDLTG